ncbi:MAG: hypothetical protein IJJ44_05425 [Solobacterium sp.]|nr:hypothetical protein [Solobacterium sp.]
MGKLLKKLMAVILAFQMSMSALPVVHAEEPENIPEETAEQIIEEELSEEEEPEVSEEETEEVTEENEEEEAPAEQVTAEAEEPEETVLPEEPEETVIPEEPEETETPEEPEETVTPEEPEETAVPEEPEETEIPEEPEETEDPSEIIPEEEGEELPELEESELFQLKITAKEYTDSVSINSVQYNTELDNGTYTVQFTTGVSETPYIVAVKDDTVWFLHNNGTSYAATFRAEVKFNLPAGKYELRTAYFQGKDLYESESYKTLVVLDPPAVTGKGDFKGTEYGYIDVDLGALIKKGYTGLPLNNIYLTLEEEVNGTGKISLLDAGYYAPTGVFRAALGDSSAYNDAGYFKDIKYGSIKLSYQIKSSSAVQGDYVYTSSDTVQADIMSAFVPNELQIYLYGAEYYMYKGATGQFVAEFWPLNEDANFSEFEGIDRRIKWTSSHPNILKVDANGTVTVVSVPKNPVNVTITATSLAYPDIAPATHTIEVSSIPYGKTSMKAVVNDVEYKTLNWTLRQQEESNCIAMLNFNIEDGYMLYDMPVTFSVDGDGLGLIVDPTNPEFADTVGTYYTFYDYGGANVLVRAQEAGSYKVKVTTAIGATAEITVNIDGISKTWNECATKDSQYFVNGKPVSGWIRYDKLTDSYVYGKDVFKGFEDIENQRIYYADPKTKKLACGNARAEHLLDTVITVDGKLYAFSAYYGLIVPTNGNTPKDGTMWIGHETAGEITLYAKKTGEIQTGWQTADGYLVYCEKPYGKRAENKFVPAKSGKGYVYVDGGGVPSGYNIDRGVDLLFSDADGLYEVKITEASSYYYQLFWVKNGAFYTGWLYLHYDAENKPYWNTTKKGAVEKMYFNPGKNGVLEEDEFKIGGKTYYAYPSYDGTLGYHYKTVSLLNNKCFGDGKFPEKYGIHPEDGLVIDADGAVVFNKLVKVAVWNGSTYDKHYVYAGENGTPVKDKWLTISGKKYYFDNNGYMDMPDMVSTNWFYRDADNNPQMVYVKTKNAKKPTDGYAYYSNDGKKLSNLMIYESDYTKKAFMLDAKGNLITGKVATVKNGMNAGAGSATYVADAEGKVVTNTTGYPYKIVEVKGKRYAVDGDGVIQKNSVTPINASEDYYSTWVMADKNGVLYKNTFRTITTEEAGTVKVYFNEDCYAIPGSASIYYDNGVYYYAWYAKKKSWLAIAGMMEPYLLFVVPGKTKNPYSPGEKIKAGQVGGSNSPIYLNKDGSIKTGFVKTAEGTRYLATIDYGYVVPVQGNTVYPDTERNLLYWINNKTYFFDEQGLMVTGWVHFEHALVVDAVQMMLDVATDYKMLDDVYMYFDPKTGAAVTKSAKVLAPAVYDGKISLGEEGTFQNNAKRVNTTSSLKTLYFTADGDLIRDQNTKVGKKLSEIGTDGVVTTGTPHWSDAYKTTYVMKNGALATGRKKIDGKYYYFDTVTGIKVTNALRKTGKKWYYYGAFGEQETPALSDYSLPVTLPVNMQGDEWGQTAYVMTGSTTFKDLTAIWNKDGSLKKIVYTGTTKAAAGESVSFGLWDKEDLAKCEAYVKAGLNGYVLDSKGLPMTGVVTGFTYGEDSYTLNVGKDGKRVVAETLFSLVKVGKKYYAMNGGKVMAGSAGIYEVSHWSSLPASEQKSLDEMAKIAGMFRTGLYAYVNADGTVAVNTKIYSSIEFPEETYLGKYVEGMWTTNKQGIILDLVAPMFKVGKTTYISSSRRVPVTNTEEVTLYGLSEEDTVRAEIRYVNNKLTGFYDVNTGKPVTGTYGLSVGDNSMLLWLKNGKPVSGNKTINYYGVKMKFWVDANMIGTVMYYD